MARARGVTLRDPARVARMGEAARRTAAAELSPHSFLHRMERLLQDVARRPR